jgi:hypothetical protein
MGREMVYVRKVHIRKRGTQGCGVRRLFPEIATIDVDLTVESEPVE